MIRITGLTPCQPDAAPLTWYFTLALLTCYRLGVTLPERGRVVYA
jgi:hypothetical protein